MIVLSLFLIVLLVTGVVLVWEARSRKLTPLSHSGATIRAALFFAAVVIGGALFVRTSGSSLLLAATLIPVTGLSLYRLAMLIRPVLGGSISQVATTLAVLAVVLCLGLGASLSLLPEPLDQRIIVEKILFGESSGERSIDPAARRTSRV